MSISLKRAYEATSRSDGCRILVERLWPRGLSKQDAKIDLWPKEAAPSTELRRWFNHELDKWPSSSADTSRSCMPGGSRWSPFSSAFELVGSLSSLPRESRGSTTPSLSRSTWSARPERICGTGVVGRRLRSRGDCQDSRPPGVARQGPAPFTVRSRFWSRFRVFPTLTPSHLHT